MNREVRDGAVDALACYRLTRLVTRDTITRPLRVRLIRYAYRKPRSTEDAQPVRWTEGEWDDLPHGDEDAPKLAAFIICPYCVGMYISFGVVLLRRYYPQAWEPVARVLALSAAAALIAGLEDG